MKPHTFSLPAMINTIRSQYLANDDKDPILRIAIYDPTIAIQLHVATDYSDDMLKNSREAYSLQSIADKIVVMDILDCLVKDVDDPVLIHYRFKNKYNLQLLQKYMPNITKTYFYKDEEIPQLKLKVKNGIISVFDQFKTDIIGIVFNYPILPESEDKINARYATYMQDLVNSVIHDNFCVINEININEFGNKYVKIKEKEKKENDNDACRTIY